MPNVIGQIPEFTEDTPTSEPEITAVAESATESVSPDETDEETVTPPEPPTEEKPVGESEKPDADIGNLQAKLLREIEGLKQARLDLLDEVKDLRGQKRELKQAELTKIEEQIDDLKDTNPDDVALIDRILKAKGYVAKNEVNRMFYEARKQETLDKFLSEFPEYKEENDPNNAKWGTLLKEVGLYKEPENPQGWGAILRRAHKALTETRVASDRDSAIKRRQAEVAGVGAGGTQRSSSIKTLDSRKRLMLEQGGWSKEEIDNIEKRL